MIKGNELIEIGYQSGPLIGQMIKRINEHQKSGINDRQYLLKLLKREFGEPDFKLKMRDQPLPFGAAIEATCDDDARNIQAVNTQMNALLKTPIIEGGAIMPDACPAGSAKATIPVGGAIAVKNAIIPSAHSADICCSMYATFYESNSQVSVEMDALMNSTRFGPGGRDKEDLVDHPVLREKVWGNKFLSGLENYAKFHLADQGDGNHFAYIGEITFSRSQINKLLKAGYSKIAEQLMKSRVDLEHISLSVDKMRPRNTLGKMQRMFQMPQHGLTMTPPMVKNTGRLFSMLVVGHLPTTKLSIHAS